MSSENHNHLSRAKISSRQPTPSLVIIRLVGPLLIVMIAFLFCDRLIDLLEATFSLVFVHAPIYLFSTRYQRLIGFALYLAVCLAVSILRPLSGSWSRTILCAGILATTTASTLHLTGQAHPILLAGLLVFVFFANGQQAQEIARMVAGSRLVDLSFLLGVGIAELLLVRPFAYWVWFRASGRVWSPPSSFSFRRFVPGALLASALFALLLPYPTLARLGVRYFLDPQAERIYGGDTFSLSSPADIAWLAFDSARQRLYVCGNGTDVVLVLDARSSDTRLRPTDVKTDGAQFCGFIPQRGEILAYEQDSGFLSWVDATTMAVIRRVNVGRIPLEVYIGYDVANDAIFLTSESGRETGTAPGLVVSATSGEIMGRFRHGSGEIGNIAMHPNGHFAYFAFFTSATGIVKFDVARREPVATVQGDPRLDRLLVDGRRNELLVASPVHSRVLVYDAVTMQSKRPIATVFGARSLAIDHKRDVLLVTSLLSNELDVIDLDTRTSVATFRLGPWLRDVALDEQAGVAYVTSRHGLYKVRYAERLRR
jgi:DNA-binding beta-propeller fold protein YncE